MGATDPNHISFQRFQEIAVGQVEPQGSAKPSQLPSKSKGAKGKKDVKDVNAEENISDYRGLIKAFREDNFYHESIRDLEREDRAQCRTILRGFFGMYQFLDFISGLTHSLVQPTSWI